MTTETGLGCRINGPIFDCTIGFKDKYALHDILRVTVNVVDHVANLSESTTGKGHIIVPCKYIFYFDNVIPKIPQIPKTTIRDTSFIRNLTVTILLYE